MQRRDMIDTLVICKLLAPWTHDERLDDAVFRVAAEFPLHDRQITPSYMIPGGHVGMDLLPEIEERASKGGVLGGPR